MTAVRSIAVCLAASVGLASCFVVTHPVAGVDAGSAAQRDLSSRALKGASVSSAKAHQKNILAELYVPGELRPSFEYCSVTHSNLGGEGPDSGAPTLRYANVTVTSGMSVDLVVTVKDAFYRAGNNARNGFTSPFGSINARCGVDAYLTFSLYLHETMQPVRAEKLYFAFFDVDSGSAEGLIEQVGFDVGLVEYYVTHTTELKLVPSERGPYWASTTPGTGADNPTSGTNMTQQQKNRAVAALFVNQSSITAHIGVKRPNNSVTCPPEGRNFLFAYRPSVLVTKPLEHKAVKWTTTTTTPKCLQLHFGENSVIRSNLGGKGPDVELTNGVLFSKVSTYYGKKIDLAVSVVSGNYAPGNTSRNCVFNGMASINGACGSEARMRFQLLDSFDGSPVYVPRLCVSFADLDTGINGACSESITIGGFTGFHLSKDTELSMASAGGGEKTIVAGAHGDGSDNPSGGSHAARSLRRTVEFEFADAAEFEATLAWSPLPGWRGATGRNILIGGSKNLR